MVEGNCLFKAADVIEWPDGKIISRIKITSRRINITWRNTRSSSVLSYSQCHPQSLRIPISGVNTSFLRYFPFFTLGNRKNGTGVPSCEVRSEDTDVFYLNFLVQHDTKWYNILNS